MNLNWRPRDEALNDFVDSHIDSFVTWDLLLFFHFNPEISDTAEGLAGRLGRPASEVALALERFCGRGLVQKCDGGQSYRLNVNEELRQNIARFAHAQEDRELRLGLIRSILQKNRQ